MNCFLRKHELTTVMNCCYRNMNCTLWCIAVWRLHATFIIAKVVSQSIFYVKGPLSHHNVLQSKTIHEPLGSIHGEADSCRRQFIKKALRFLLARLCSIILDLLYFPRRPFPNPTGLWHRR